MLKDKDKSVENTDNEVGCGAPTPALARHIPNDETVKALQDTSARRNLIRYDSFEDFKKDMLSGD